MSFFKADDFPELTNLCDANHCGLGGPDSNKPAPYHGGDCVAVATANVANAKRDAETERLRARVEELEEEPPRSLWEARINQLKAQLEQADNDERDACGRGIRLARQCQDLEADNARLRKALEWYADAFKIMDHIDGTYTIHDTWHAKARAALGDK